MPTPQIVEGYLFRATRGVLSGWWLFKYAGVLRSICRLGLRRLAIADALAFIGVRAVLASVFIHVFATCPTTPPECAEERLGWAWARRRPENSQQTGCRRMIFTPSPLTLICEVAPRTIGSDDCSARVAASMLRWEPPHTIRRTGGCDGCAADRRTHIPTCWSPSGRRPG
jgi:hypothetical protein